MLRLTAATFTFVLFVAALAVSSHGQTPVNGGQLFQQKCAICHGNPDVERAPDISILRKIPAERVYQTLTTGGMATQAQDLTIEQRRAVAEYLGERKLVLDSSAEVRTMSNRCQSNPPLRNVTATPAWNGWGVDVSNSRFQPATAAGLTSADVPKLKLRWSFGFPGATAVYGQPSIVGGRVFVGVDTGNVYSLDVTTGCAYWSFQAQAGVRTAITVVASRARQDRYNAYFGDMRGNVYAVDAGTGEQLWKISADDHQLARITGAPTFYDGRLYVPVSSLEEGAAGNLSYPCCTFRGSVLALDARNRAPNLENLHNR